MSEFESQAPIADHNKRIGYFVTGTIGLILSTWYLWMSREYPWGQMDQPGARLWPTIIGIMMVVASGFVLWEAWKMSPKETFEMPAGPGAIRVVIMIALMVTYFLVMEYLGQLISSFLFCLFFMRMISPLSWPRLVLAASCIAGGLYIIFDILLKIPMPKGLLGP